MAEDWISTTEAAALLSAAGDRIDRSTLSRYLKQHAEALPTRREGRQNLVHYPTLLAHRKENIRIHASTGSPAPVQTGGGEKGFQGTQVSGAARKAMADAELRELDLAERRGELTVTAEVDRAGQDALGLMRVAFDRAVETEAARYAMKYGWDERTVRGALKTFARAGVDVFHQELMNRLDMIRRQQEGEGDRSAAVEPETVALQ